MCCDEQVAVVGPGEAAPAAAFVVLVQSGPVDQAGAFSWLVAGQRGDGEAALGASTDAIESVNARIHKAVRARGHFPNEAAALKCVYMAVMSLDPTGSGRKRWTMRWKPALQAFDIAFDGRLTAGHR